MIVFFSLCFSELLLRILGPFTSYTEKNCHTYVSPYQDTISNYGKKHYYYTHAQNFHLKQKFTEYTYEYTSNSLGLVDREIPLKKQSKEVRIFCLGDSFTEGAGSDSIKHTWPAFLQDQLKQLYPNKNIQVYNCGIVGSDICAQFVLLKEVLSKYNPDVIIIAINISDVRDIVVRGGLERFHKDTHAITFKSEPWWEPLYHHSHLFRFFVHTILGYSEEIFEIKKAALPQLQEDAILTIKNTMIAINDFSKHNNINSIFVLHPYPFEVQSGAYAFPSFAQQLKQVPNLVVRDLLASYKQTQSITSHNYRNYYWQLDAHHNVAGYKIMGQQIARECAPLIFGK